MKQLGTWAASKLKLETNVVMQTVVVRTKMFKYHYK